MNLRDLIRQEIIAREQTIVGKVLSQRRRLDFDAAGGPVWVVDVDVGGERVVRDVPIKTGSDGTVRYADLGQTVALRRNTQGRYDITGPGDRIIDGTEVIDYIVATGLDNGTGVDFGFAHEAKAFDFYQGPTPPTPGTSLWADGVNGFPKIAIVDAQGNEV